MPKISELTELTDPLSGDWMPIVDSSTGITKRINWSTINAGRFNVVAYGAIGNGITDDTAAIQAAITAAGSESVVYFPDGDYLVTSTITVTDGGVRLYCNSPRSAVITFTPTTNDTCIYFNLTQNLGAIYNLWFKSTDTTYVKTAIEFIDGSDFHIKGVNIGGSGTDWTDDTNASVGINANGREIVSINQVRIFADTPILLSGNPNHASLDCDQFHLSDTYLVVTENVANACMEIEDAVNLYNFTVDGYNAWARGRYGLLWDSPNSTLASFNIKLSNIRFEQAYEGGGDAYVMYIDHSDYAIQVLTLDNIYGATTATNGFYIKGAQELRASNINCPCDGVALQLIDNTAGDTRHVEWNRCLWGNDAAASAVLPSHLRLRSAISEFSTNQCLPLTAIYSTTSGTLDNDKGTLVGENARNFTIARSLIAPQTTASGDLDFDDATDTITSSGAVDFTGILADEVIYVGGTASNDGHYEVESDGTTTTLVLKSGLSDEATADGTIIHGVSLPGHRNDSQYAAVVDATLYASAEASALQTENVRGMIGKTGGGSAADFTISETNNAVFGIENVGSSAAPVSDQFSLTISTQPIRIWNNRTTAASVGRVLVKIDWF